MNDCHSFLKEFSLVEKARAVQDFLDRIYRKKSRVWMPPFDCGGGPSDQNRPLARGRGQARACNIALVNLFCLILWFITFILPILHIELIA
jgi:hypothetical protein